jgi:hypothetical protein
MDVILDANQILADPRMRGSKFQVLFRYLRQTDSSLVIPKVVRDEVIARYPERIQKAKERLIDALSALESLCFRAQLPNIPELDVPIELAAFQEQLLNPLVTAVSETFESGIAPKTWRYVPSVSTGDYSTIQVEELARRGINRVRPASDKGEEFRDGILWLMALRYAKEKGREVALISKDGHFFDSNKSMHPQLKEEINREAVKIHVYWGVEDFFKLDSPSSRIGPEWIEKHLGDRSKEVQSVFEGAVADYLDSSWRSRSEVTPSGETLSHFKKGRLYNIAPDSQYVELEYEGQTKFAIGPYVFTKAPPFDPKGFPLTDVEVQAEFVVSGWVVDNRVTDMEVGDMRVHAVNELGPHLSRVA